MLTSTIARGAAVFAAANTRKAHRNAVVKKCHAPLPILPIPMRRPRLERRLKSSKRVIVRPRTRPIERVRRRFLSSRHSIANTTTCSVARFPAQFRRSVGIAAAQDEYWTFRTPNDTFGDRTKQHTLDAVVAVRWYHDQPGPSGVGIFRDFQSGIPESNGENYIRQITILYQCVQLLVDRLFTRFIGDTAPQNTG